MLDILSFVSDALDRGRPVGWARVMSTWGSAPRRPGACMAVTSPVEHAGSVSGGCVEHAVIDEILGCLASGRAQVLDYGVSDREAWAVGLSCGGTLQILVEPFQEGVGRPLVEAIRADRPVLLVTPIRPHGEAALLDADGSLVGGDEPAEGIVDAALPALGDRVPRSFTVADRTWFAHPFPARERLVIVGGAEIAVHLVPLARRVGFETVVVDAHGVFARGRAFDEPPDRLVGLENLPEPGSDTWYVLLTHDPSVDDPVLHRVLASQAPYVGALGGRKTQDRRRTRLREAGFEEDLVDRVDGPVGVPIGAATPAEIAVSITARLVETRRRRSK